MDNNLNVFVNNQPNKPLSNKFKNPFSLPKIIFIVLGIIVIIELIYAARTLNLFSASQPVNKSIISPLTAKISLDVPKATFRINEVVPVTVNINTGGHSIDGVDLIVSFDPKILEATTSGLIKGKIFDEYPLLSVDSNKGLIYISGVNSAKNAFNGIGQFALLNLKAKIPGQTTLSINFKKGATTDSNLVETGTSKNILETVNNLELTVQ